MFHSLMTIIRELYLYLTKVVFMLKHSVKLRCYIYYTHSALHTTHMPLYSLTLHCRQHTCRSTVSLCTPHNTHAALQSHSALHTTLMPLYHMLPHHSIYIRRNFHQCFNINITLVRYIYKAL